MFSVDTDTGTISLSIGDTAAFSITASGYEFDENDRALFTVKDATGTAVLERVYQLADESLGNGVFVVNINNSDTDELSAGTYSWDVRYVIAPYYDSDGRIIDGDQVITPKLALSFVLLPVVGEV